MTAGTALPSELTRLHHPPPGWCGGSTLVRIDRDIRTAITDGDGPHVAQRLLRDLLSGPAGSSSPEVTSTQTAAAGWMAPRVTPAPPTCLSGPSRRGTRPAPACTTPSQAHR